MTEETITLQVLGPLPNHGRDAAGDIWSLPRRVPTQNGRGRAVGHTRAIPLRRLSWPAKGRIRIDGEKWSREELAGMETRGEITLPRPDAEP